MAGFDLARSLAALGLECVVCAPSKIQRPHADARRKNDANDAVFLAKLLATHNVTEVFIPDEEAEAARDFVRARDDLRADLMRARQRLYMFLMRRGLVFDEKAASGVPKGSWTKDHWKRVRKIGLDQAADRDAFDPYVSEVRHMEGQKRQLESCIVKLGRRRPPKHREPCGEGGRAVRRPAPEAAAEGQEARCGEHRDRPRALLLRAGHRTHG